MTSSRPAHAQVDDFEAEEAELEALERPRPGSARTVYSRSATRTRRAGIEMPELVHLEEAPYPPEAKAAGIEGDVVLRLTIDVTGQVTDAEVVEGPGEGLNEAAQAAALQFKFKPARRRGKPVPVRIDYKYSFRLESVDLDNETTTPETSSAEFQKGTVPGGSGRVERLVEPRARAGVKLPEIAHFEEATYPSDAWKEGAEAEVVLRLRVSARGAVTRADVVGSAGRGFDEAAQRAALKFRFKPARRGRRPLPVTVEYRYSFILGRVELEEEGSKLGSAGDLGGQVRVADSDGALAGVEVRVQAKGGQEYSATTDAEGRWELRDLPAGKYRVRVVSPGFQSVDETEEVSAGEATDVTYRLAPEARGLEVTVEGERPPREVTKRRLVRREIDRMPGTGGDALRSIQSLPGVARPPLVAGFIIVRGSAPEDSQAFVDTLNVPLIYHFLGLSSVLPTEMLERIDFYPGNFSARFGRGMGGVVDVGLRSPDTRCLADYMRATDETGCYHGLIQADAIAGRVMLQGPIFGSKDWSFALAGQRSWIDALYKPVLERTGASITQAPVYYDYQAIAEYRPNANSRLSLRFFGFNDRAEAFFADPAAVDPGFGGNFSLNTNYMTGQVLYEGKLGQDVELTTMLAGGQAAVDFRIGTYLFDVNSYPLQARSEIGWRMTTGVKVNLGIDVLAAPYDADVVFPPPPRQGELGSGPATGTIAKEAREKSSVFRPGAYMEWELQPWRRLRLVPGARVDYAKDTGHTDFSPRLNARLDLIPADPELKPGQASSRTTLKGGVGVFHQPPQFQETNEVYGTPGIQSNRSIHYSLGLERELTSQVELGFEGFYKSITNLVASDINDEGGLTYHNRGTGRIMGVETLLKYKPDKRFFGWVAYTLSRSVRRNGPEKEEYLFQYDQTHNLVALGSYRMGDGWEFGARFRLISGSLERGVPPSPGVPALYNADAGAYSPLFGRQVRLPLFHQLDIRLDKRWQFRRWRLSAYLDLQNAYNNRPAEQLLYSYNFSQRTYAYGLPIIPSFGLRGEF
ncbi:MAG TPA: TonB family protein [Polyangiaceae bacterium]